MAHHSDSDAQGPTGWEVREHTRRLTLLDSDDSDWEEPTVEVSADDLIVEEIELFEADWPDEADWEEDTQPDLRRPPLLLLLKGDALDGDARKHDDPGA